MSHAEPEERALSQPDGSGSAVTRCGRWNTYVLPRTTCPFIAGMVIARTASSFFNVVLIANLLEHSANATSALDASGH